MVGSNITLSSDVFRALLSGPSRLPTYYKKIAKGHKRCESTLHFTAIIIGFILGVFLSFFVLHNLSKHLGNMVHLSRGYQWVIDVAFALFVATLCSSMIFFVSKGCVDVYNIQKYGISNSQFAPLSEDEITKIINNCKTDLVIQREGVINLHDTLVKFISAQHYKIEKQKLKAAHWEFRRGSISNACTMHPLVSELVASVMDDQPLSRTFIRNRKGLSIITDLTQSGVKCNTLTERVHLITDTVQKLLEELIMLQDTLDMTIEGTRVRNYPRLNRRSMNGYHTRTSSEINVSTGDSESRSNSPPSSITSESIMSKNKEFNEDDNGKGIGTFINIIEIEMQDLSQKT